MLRLLNSLQKSIHHGHYHWLLSFKRYAVRCFRNTKYSLFWSAVQSWLPNLGGILISSDLGVSKACNISSHLDHILAFTWFFCVKDTTEVGYAYRFSLSNLTYKTKEAKVLLHCHLVIAFSFINMMPHSH